MGKRSNVTTAQRREAVLAVLRKEETVASAARRLGVSDQTLHRWRDDFLAAGEAALEGGKADNSHKQRISELEKQVGDRDQVIGELTIANRILKKLSGESP